MVGLNFREELSILHKKVIEAIENIKDGLGNDVYDLGSVEISESNIELLYLHKGEINVSLRNKYTAESDMYSVDYNSIGTADLITIYEEIVKILRNNQNK